VIITIYGQRGLFAWESAARALPGLPALVPLRVLPTSTGSGAGGDATVFATVTWGGVQSLPARGSGRRGHSPAIPLLRLATGSRIEGCASIYGNECAGRRRREAFTYGLGRWSGGFGRRMYISLWPFHHFLKGMPSQSPKTEVKWG